MNIMQGSTGISNIGRSVLLLSLLALSACSNLIFQPSNGYIYDPEKIQDYFKIKIEDVYFYNSDGHLLHGWFLPNQSGKTHGTILFLHGNGENISSHVRMVWWLARSGYNLFMPDYRGYGFSEGEPELEGAHRDVQAAMKTLLDMPKVNKNRLVLYGHSLGGAIATTSLADSPYRKHFRALIVENSFTRYRTAAREALGGFWLTWPLQYPLSWTIRDDFAPIEAISRISPIPVLFVTSSHDPVIAPDHSTELYQAAGEPRDHWVFESDRHTVFHTEQRRSRLLAYLARALK